MIYITAAEDPVAGKEVSPNITFDAITDFSPVFDKSITQYAVSDGTKITNNTVKSNTVISVTGIISNTPLKRYTNNIVSYEDNSLRDAKAYQQLRSWWEEDTRLIIVDNNYEVFRDCIIKTLKPLRNTSEGLTFTMTFVIVKYATYKRVDIIKELSSVKAKDASMNSSSSESPKEVKGALATLTDNYRDSFKGVLNE